MAIVGQPGSGKSMIFQPLELIYQTMPAPEAGSTFAMSGLVDAEIVLWQDFEYDHKTVNFQDLLRMLVGEKLPFRDLRPEPAAALITKDDHKRWQYAP